MRTNFVYQAMAFQQGLHNTRPDRKHYLSGRDGTLNGVLSQVAASQIPASQIPGPRVLPIERNLKTSSVTSLFSHRPSLFEEVEPEGESWLDAGLKHDRGLQDWPNSVLDRENEFGTFFRKTPDFKLTSLPIPGSSGNDPADFKRFQHLFSQYCPELSNGYASHLPMVVSAMCRLGATHKEVSNFVSKYNWKHKGELIPVRFRDWSLPNDFTQRFGQRDYFAAYRKDLKEKHARLGILGLLNTVMPQLSGGICASAFHALIRLGHALINDDEKEMINALAFMASSYQCLGSFSPQYLDHDQVAARPDSPQAGAQSVDPVIEAVDDDKGVTTFGDVLGWLSAHKSLSHQRVPASSIFLRLAKVRNLEGYSGLVSRMGHCPVNLLDLQEASLSIFLHRPSFTSLHLLTAVHAVGKLLPKLDDGQLLLQYLGLAIANAYVGIGTPAITEKASIDKYLQDQPLPNWPILARKAVVSGREHDIKMVQACQDMQEQTGRSDYALAAAMWLDTQINWRNGQNPSSQGA